MCVPGVCPPVYPQGVSLSESLGVPPFGGLFCVPTLSYRIRVSQDNIPTVNSLHPLQHITELKKYLVTDCYRRYTYPLRANCVPFQCPQPKKDALKQGLSPYTETPPVTRRERSKRIVSESNYSNAPIVASRGIPSRQKEGLPELPLGRSFGKSIIMLYRIMMDSL